MKTTIVYVVVLLGLVYGENEIRLTLYRQDSHRYENLYKHLLQDEKDGQICIPESKFGGICQTCFCSEHGTKIICVINEACPYFSRHRRQVPNDSRLKGASIDQSCTMCSCESQNPSEPVICQMSYYEVCPVTIP